MQQQILELIKYVSEKDLESQYKKWETSRSIISTKIQAYFRNQNISEMWDTFAKLVINFVHFVGIVSEEDRLKWFEKNENFFSNPNIELRDWEVMKNDILKQKDAIITIILNSDISSLQKL